MIACVFNQEILLADRRGRMHWLRWLYAAFVLAQIVPTFVLATSFNEWLHSGGFEGFFERFIVLHFGLIVLLTPALLAGAISEEKTTGTLQYLLTAYLSPGEIVLGKMLARSYQLVLMSLAGLPMIALCSGFGGIGGLPAALALLSIALIFGLAAVSMLASVWCRHTRDALLSVYLLVLAFFVVRGLGGARLVALGNLLDPLAALGLDSAYLNWRKVGSCTLAWSVLGLVCLCIASLRLRGAYLRQLRAVPRAASRWLPGRRPRIGNNPVLWRERHVVGVTTLPWLRRWPRWLGCVAVAALTLATLAWGLQQVLPAGVSLTSLARQGRWLELRTALRAATRSPDVFYWHGVAMLFAASLIVAVRASGCISDEREKSTWETLLQTPLHTRTILRGKQWGILGAFAPYLVSHAVVALGVGLFVGAAATVWTVLWLLATVFAVLFVVVVGIWCSAQMQNSWWSMLATLGFCYGIWILLTFPVALGFTVVQGFLGLILGFIDWLFDTGPALNAVLAYDPQWLIGMLTFVAAFWFLTHRLLVEAERVIQRRDRARATDPQFQEFHARWLEQVERAARIPRPIEAALWHQPLPIAPESAPEPAAVAIPVEIPEDTDALLPVPQHLVPDYNQQGS